jgi:F420-dependent oxidoreductase-like protein
MRVPITLDLHLSSFNYPGVEPHQLFDKVIDIATTAEASGFSSVSVMDHLHQIPVVGPPQNYMLEGSTILAGIAARTTELSLGLLVGSVTYRNPALAAKITTTLDIISGGRVWHGIGAGWFEEEHVAYGFQFPPLGERLARVDEALQIFRSMFTEEQTHFDGKYFKVAGAYNNPKPIRGDIPILIGGSGEKKTLRMVAKYGDACNLFGDATQVKHLLGVLEAHCEEVGRDFSEITKTAMGMILIAPTHEQAQARVKLAVERGLPAFRVDTMIYGDADSVGERVTALREAGAEGMTIGMPEVDDLEAVAEAGRTLGPVFAASVH